jgi:acyl-CoA synthetase (AMP-forming)/AMP-acid ligase II
MTTTTGDDWRSALFMPLFHTAALGLATAAVLRGTTVVLLRGFEPDAVLDTIERERISYFLALPMMIRALLETPGFERRDLSSLELIGYAMAPMPDNVLKTAGMTREQADRMRTAWKGLHDDEATWSTHSRHELVPDATHYIQLDRPDLVIKAVREVVGAVRTGATADSTESRAGASR